MSRWISPASCAVSSASAIGAQEPQRARAVELAGDDQVLERRPADQAHRDEQPLVDLAGLVDRDDVRVVERRLDAALAAEALAERRRPSPSCGARSFSATVRSSDSWRAS